MFQRARATAKCRQPKENNIFGARERVIGGQAGKNAAFASDRRARTARDANDIKVGEAISPQARAFSGR
jgi:hypothetical protein